jgi:ankyrin repeat protein
MLLDKGAQVDERDDNGDQPIHSAAKSGCKLSVNILIEFGAWVCGGGHLKNTVLHYASKMGRLQLVDHILKQGCPPNLENDLKETPLHLAAGFYTKGTKGLFK